MCSTTTWLAPSTETPTLLQDQPMLRALARGLGYVVSALTGGTHSVDAVDVNDAAGALASFGIDWGSIG